MKKFVGIFSVVLIVLGMILIYKNITGNENVGTIVNGATERGKKYDDFEEMKVTEDEKIVFKAFELSLGIYNKTYGSFCRAYTENNQTIMPFQENVDDNVYISNTNDNKNGSKCYSFNNDKIKCIYKSDDNVCLLPLCTNGKDFYYIYESYKEGLGSGNREIIKIENGNKIDILKTNNLQLYDGAIIDDVIYYTVYMEESNTYDMYSFNLKTSKNKLEKEGLVDGLIFEYKNQILYLDKTKLYSDTKVWNLGVELSDIVIVEDKDKLLGYNITKDGDLELQIIDMKTSKVVDRIEGIISYELKNDTLTVYCAGGRGIVTCSL